MESIVSNELSSFRININFILEKNLLNNRRDGSLGKSFTELTALNLNSMVHCLKHIFLTEDILMDLISFLSLTRLIYKNKLFFPFFTNKNSLEISLQRSPDMSSTLTLMLRSK